MTTRSRAFAAVAILADMLIHPGISPTRRVLGALADITLELAQLRLDVVTGDLAVGCHNRFRTHGLGLLLFFSDRFERAILLASNARH